MKPINKILREDIDNSRTNQGKRVLAGYTSTLHDLNNELPNIFGLLQKALRLSTLDLNRYPREAWSKGLESNIIQTNFAVLMISHYGNSVLYGTFRRLIIKLNGYLILFKKLNKKGYPMNIRTDTIDSILSQKQLIDLYRGQDASEPILYLGYQTDSFGEYVNPQLIYIDEDRIVFTIDENSILNSGIKTRRIASVPLSADIVPNSDNSITISKIN